MVSKGFKTSNFSWTSSPANNVKILFRKWDYKHIAYVTDKKFINYHFSIFAFLIHIQSFSPFYSTFSFVSSRWCNVFFNNFFFVAFVNILKMPLFHFYFKDSWLRSRISVWFECSFAQDVYQKIRKKLLFWKT